MPCDWPDLQNERSSEDIDRLDTRLYQLLSDRSTAVAKLNGRSSNWH